MPDFVPQQPFFPKCEFAPESSRLPEGRLPWHPRQCDNVVMGWMVLKPEHDVLFDTGIPNEYRVGYVYPVTMRPVRMMDWNVPTPVVLPDDPPEFGRAGGNFEACRYTLGHAWINWEGRAGVLACSNPFDGQPGYFQRVSVGRGFVFDELHAEAMRDKWEWQNLRAGYPYHLVAFHSPQVREATLYSTRSSCGLWN